MKILIIGTGFMANEYAKVLKGLKIKFEVVGRSAKNCEAFRTNYPWINVIEGGVEELKDFSGYTHTIVASNVDFLGSHTKLLIENGIKNILLEKPGGSSIEDIENLHQDVKYSNTTITLAYNRRFYASVTKAKEMIALEGGPLSFNFEFTEWPHTIETISNFELGRKNLLITNSSHVIDMAFYLGGFPKQMHSVISDKINWHTPAIFAGSGVSNTGALFNYQANWKSPGRWSVEILTKERRYIFRPLEKLQIQELKSVKQDFLEIEDKIDIDYKPGLYEQTKTWLYKPNSENLISLNSFCEHINVYRTILTGGEL